MKLFNFFVLMVLGLGVLSMTSCASGNFSKVKVANEMDSVSYNLGVAVAASFPAADFPDLNISAIAKGFADGRDTSLNLDAKAANDAVGQFMQGKQAEIQARLQKEREVEMAKATEENKTKFADENKAQQDFIAATTIKEGVTTTATGLMYEVIKKGSGTKPTATDVVKVNYVGTHLNGEEFDSSYKTGKPAVFGLNQVIPGWTEGIALMSPGAKYKFYIPSDLAYGDAGGRMPPFSLLTFEVELLEVNPKAAGK